MPPRGGPATAASVTRRRGVRAAALVTAATLMALAALAALGRGEERAAAAPGGEATRGHIAGMRPLPVGVFIDAHLGRRVPQGFLGLSFEVSRLQQVAQYSGRGNLTRLLRSLGPGLLRFGGASADTRVAWTDL